MMFRHVESSEFITEERKEMYGIQCCVNISPVNRRDTIVESDIDTLRHCHGACA